MNNIAITWPALGGEFCSELARAGGGNFVRTWQGNQLVHLRSLRGPPLPGTTTSSSSTSSIEELSALQLTPKPTTSKISYLSRSPSTTSARYLSRSPSTISGRYLSRSPSTTSARYHPTSPDHSPKCPQQQVPAPHPTFPDRRPPQVPAPELGDSR